MSAEELAGLATIALCEVACLGDHLQERVLTSSLTVGELKLFNRVGRGTTVRFTTLHQTV